jgi:aerobic-type carbon monoxide dehydrogenase small subunit (CoxS/CutS family)
MMMAAEALLRTNPSPSRAEIQTALGGHVCRCTGYVKIIDAVAAAARGDSFDLAVTAEGQYTTMQSGGGS